MKTKEIKILRGIAFSLSVLAMSPNTCNAAADETDADASDAIISIDHNVSALTQNYDGSQLVDPVSKINTMTLRNVAFTLPDPNTINNADGFALGGDSASLIPNAADMKALHSSVNNAMLGTTSINNVGTINGAQVLNKNLGATTMNSSGSTDMGNMSGNNVNFSGESNVTDIASNTVDHSTTNDHESGGSVGGSISADVDTSLESEVHAL